MLVLSKTLFIVSFVIIFVSEYIYCSSEYNDRDSAVFANMTELNGSHASLHSKVDGIIRVIQDYLLENIKKTLKIVTKNSNSVVIKNGESLIANISQQVIIGLRGTILPKIDEQKHTVNNNLQDINSKLELLENSFNNKIKEAIDSAMQTMANDSFIRQTTMIQSMANKNKKELQDIIEKTLATKLELLENNLNNKKKETDSAIANLINVVQTICQKLTNLENITLALQTQLQNCTAAAPQTNIKGNETNSVRRECEADTSDCRLLHVTVPSSVRARPDIWKRGQIPEEDDLDKFMKNATGCQYKAREYSDWWQSVSNSTARGGTWRRRLAVRGEGETWIRVTWDAGHDYYFGIGTNSNTETQVYDNIQFKYVLDRTTPGVMSKEKYTQFFYLQLEDGVMSFGALNESTPWLRQSVTVSAGEVVHMEYGAASGNGVKLLVCE